jgi:hypothetical protein
MTEEATQTGAESSINDGAADTDESLLRALSGDEPDDVSDDGDFDESGEPQPKAETYTVKINGAEKEVTREELIAHYQKGEASNQKFEEAAAIRREAEAQQAAIVQHQEQLQQALNHFNVVAQQWAAEGQPNWQDLLDNNPHEYLRQQAIWQERSARYQEAQTAQAHLNQQRQQQEHESLSKHLEAESARLVNEIIPEWKDKATRERDEQELISYLTGQGYSQQDLVNLSNSRASNIGLARKAMLYDKAMTKINSLKNPQPTAANPVPTVGNRSGAQKASIFNAGLGYDDFVKQRQAQIKSRR